MNNVSAWAAVKSTKFSRQRRQPAPCLLRNLRQHIFRAENPASTHLNNNEQDTKVCWFESLKVVPINDGLSQPSPEVYDGGGNEAAGKQLVLAQLSARGCQEAYVVDWIVLTAIVR